MTETLDKLTEYLQFPAVRYAIIVGLLISLCSSLLGVTLVMKRFSFIGDGLSHVAFGAMAIATVLNVTDNMLIIMPVTVVSAVLLLRTGQNTKIKGDAAVAMISVGALALGYLLMNLAPKNGRASANLSADVCSTLFGSTSILTLSQKDVITCVVMSAIVVAVFFFFYTKISAVTFDESFAKATGIRSDLYNLLIAVVIAVIIVFAMNFVGSLLISALIIFPALSSMRVFKTFKKVIVSSGFISVICFLLGIYFSYTLNISTGAMIVIVNLVTFIIFTLVGKIKEA